MFLRQFLYKVFTQAHGIFFFLPPTQCLFFITQKINETGQALRAGLYATTPPHPYTQTFSGVYASIPLAVLLQHPPSSSCPAQTVNYNKKCLKNI
jgi:hypothetical protein